MTSCDHGQPVAGLFVTCLADLMRPSVGFAAAALIEAAGCRVEVPRLQTCCGQPAYNSGDRATARAIAEATMTAFDGCDYVVVPSGSCAAMLKLHYPKLFTGDGDLAVRAAEFARRVHELTAFLAAVRHVTRVPGEFRGRVAFHDACSGLRELGLGAGARALLGSMDGVELVPIEDADVCCGFGGLFSVKYPDVSAAVAGKKCAAIAAAAPDLLVGPDLGCLMNIAGKAKRAGLAISCRHIAEVLAGELASPAIGEGER